MADANAPKRLWPWGILRDAIVSTAIAFGLDAWVKDWVKDLFTKHVGQSPAKRSSRGSSTTNAQSFLKISAS